MERNEIQIWFQTSRRPRQTLNDIHLSFAFFSFSLFPWRESKCIWLWTVVAKKGIYDGGNGKLRHNSNAKWEIFTDIISLVNFISPSLFVFISGVYREGCAAFSNVSPNVVADESVMKTDEGMTKEQKYTKVGFFFIDILVNLRYFFAQVKWCYWPRWMNILLRVSGPLLNLPTHQLLKWPSDKQKAVSGGFSCRSLTIKNHVETI